MSKVLVLVPEMHLQPIHSCHNGSFGGLAGFQAHPPFLSEDEKRVLRKMAPFLVFIGGLGATWVGITTANPEVIREGMIITHVGIVQIIIVVVLDGEADIPEPIVGVLLEGSFLMYRVYGSLHEVAVRLGLSENSFYKVENEEKR